MVLTDSIQLSLSEIKDQCLSETKHYSRRRRMNISLRYKCTICEDILNEPAQGICGCRFCFECIEDQVHSGNTNCPNCHLQISSSDFVKDKAIEKEILKLQIQCDNEGCDYICELKDMISHVDICEYRLFQCDTCQLLFPYNIRDEHLTNRCQKMMIKCNECGLKMAREYLKTKHRNIEQGPENLCSELKGSCPYQCDDCDNIEESIKSHMMKCSRRSISCPLIDLGCVVKSTSNDISMHLQTDILQHMALMMNEITRLRMENENLSKSFQSTNQSMTHKINSLKQINEELIENVDKLKSIEIENGKLIENLKSEIYKNQISINNQSINIYDSINVIDGECTWIIRDIRRKCLEAKSNNGNKQILSDPFYCCRPGYKMRVKLYPNGDGKGQDKYLSIYFVIVKGEYDEEISWPFNRKITLSIVSSRNTSRNLVSIMKPDNNISCYGKPINDTNVGAGQPQFTPMSEIMNNGNYLHDGSLIVKLKY